MGRKVKIFLEIKIKVIEEYLVGKIRVKQIADQLQVSFYSVGIFFGIIII